MLLDRCPWYIAGPVLGLVIIGLRATVNQPLGVTGEPIGWSVERPRTRHVAGSILFAFGWTVAGTCPGPVAAMIGEGRLVGVPVVVGLLAGVTLQGMLAARKTVEPHMPAPAVTGL
jgi:uncharacterized membrane protein YedE/YeeE